MTYTTYGACFSPDASKLYISVEEDSPKHRLLQFDLNAEDVAASRVDISTDDNDFAFGAIELAPDGNIYVARSGGVNFLSAIRQPNALGIDCDFEREGINLGTGESTLGLPNILYNYDSKAFYEFFPRDTALCFDEVLYLDLDTLNATTYLWDNGNSFSDNSISDAGWHWLDIETETCGNGRDSILLDFIDCSCRVVFPNAFSPNDDGFNDTFEPVLATCDYSTYILKIYSRHGDLVFETEDKTQAWDGNLKGRKMPTGVYVYYLLYKNPKERGLKRLVGDISLLR